MAADNKGDVSPRGGTPYQRLETSRAVNADALDKNLKKKETGSNALGNTAQDNASKFKFTDLYRYGTPFDKLLLAIGIVLAGANGALNPLMALAFGNVLSGFASTPVDMDTVDSAALDFTLIAVALFVTDYGSYVALVHSAERQIKALRREALKRMLYLDISWYDEQDALQLSSRLTGDTVRIKDGMGPKLGDAFRYTLQFVVGFVIGFARGWDITLVMSAIIPVVMVLMKNLIKTIRARADWSQQVYAEAGSVAEETLGSMRAVTSLNAETKAIAKFEEKVNQAEKDSIAQNKKLSAVFSMFRASVWVAYAVGLWYGGWKISQDDSEPSDVFAVFFSVMLGTSSLGKISPSISAVSNASGAAHGLFAILDTRSVIDAESHDDGIVPTACEGKIEAKHVNFTYPSRPDAQVLRDYNVTIEPGQFVAFAGASGGGKSTIAALLERFYDPTGGAIYLDGRDIKELNVKWLRSQIGMVSQEPVLFGTTIFENIAMGAENVSREEAVAACKLSNAHDFIMALPEQYDTLAGEKGVSLSGGQKQRVAIARAIIRKPKILILDEATSALDNESEKLVQAALDNLMDTTNMTTLVIAHRLSTIRHADKIVVLEDGHVAESGTHDELVQLEHGIYRTMYQNQELQSRDEEPQAMLPEVEWSDNVKLSRSKSNASSKTNDSVINVENNTLVTEPFGLMDIARLSKAELKFYIIGIIGACASGLFMPMSAVLVAEMMTTMTNKFGLFQASGDKSYLSDLYDKAQLYGILFLVAAVVIMVFIYMETYCFKFIEEKITTRLRKMNFEGLCRQNIGFFDEKEHAVGALTADLATNATKVGLISGDSQAQAFQAMFTLISALVISFGFGSWLLSLIMLATIPFLLIGSIGRTKQVGGGALLSDDLAVPGAHASEVLTNVRTVAALGIQQKSVDVFDELLEEPLRKGYKETQIDGISLGFSSSIMMATYALIFWYGAKKVNDGSITFEELSRSLMVIMMSIRFVSGAFSFLADAPSAFKAGSTITAIRDRVAPIDSFSSEGLQLAAIDGRLEFRDVSFRYPTRPEVQVLKHYNLVIEAGQTVAFCGSSGGGKSTIISLLERFYDPVAGDVLLDGHDIRKLNLRWLRSQIGLVAQEPSLFIGTIAENIAYGLPETPTQQEIEEAAKVANAHNFITQFPDGYNTQVGMQGEQLSGGQKQRIAIARATLKNPSILLLDEATSALDSQSEKVVQAALAKVMAWRRRTTIIIAHRLPTIQNADKICVVSDGKVAEQGTHHELVQRNGIYADLVASASS